jgi:DNA-binding response OmpR family regulator
MKKTKGEKILIIEDDKLFAEIYTEKFAEAGFDVSLAVNGEDGLRRLREERPDIALLDLVLPKMSGFEVLEAVGADKDAALRKIPIFVVTNLGQESDMIRAKALGAKAYFVKANTLFSTVLAKVREELG